MTEKSYFFEPISTAVWRVLGELYLLRGHTDSNLGAVNPNYV